MEMKYNGSIELQNMIYLGHPLAEKLYLTNFLVKCFSGKWNIFIREESDEVKEVHILSCGFNKDLDFDFSDKRQIKNSPAVLLTTKDIFEGLTEMDMTNLVSSCKKYRSNKNFLPFEEYTDKVLNDRLAPLETLETMDTELALKYVRYRDRYDADLKYSDKEEPIWKYLRRDGLFLFVYSTSHDFLINFAFKDNLLIGIKLKLVES